MKTLYFTFVAILSSCMLQAQQAKWFSQKDLYNFENNLKTIYVSSTTNPCLINHMEETFQMIPNGPVIQPMEYAVAYDTSGAELWSRKLVNQYHGLLFPAQVIKFLTKEDDKFWMVLGAAGDTLKIGNQFLVSPYNDTLYNSIYFVEMDRSGTILNYFTYAFKLDVKMYINDIVFDRSGNFILAGSVQPNVDTPYPNTTRPFSFGSYAGILFPDQRKNFIAQIHPNGTEATIFQFDSHMPMFWTYTNLSIIFKAAINTLNGNIVFVGTLGDTLAIQSNTMINTTPTTQLFLCSLDSNLNYLSSKSETVATSGTFIYGLNYNPVSDAFYFMGSWDGFLNYGQSSPLAGGNGFFGNDSYVAKLQSGSLNLDTLIPVLPVPHTNNTLALCLDLATSKDGSLYIAGFTDDSVVAFSNKVYHLNNPNWDNFPFVLKLSPNLSVDTALFAATNGVGRFNAIQIHHNEIYCGGCFNGTFSMNNISGTSAYQLDASILRIDVNTFPSSEFDLQLTPVCKGEVIIPQNNSWGQPAPSYTWTTIPSVGVTYSPSAIAASPQIHFSNAGNYTITCVASNTLGNNSSAKIFSVSICAGINEINSAIGLNVLPNPSNGPFEITNFSSESKGYELRVTNALGQLILEQTYVSSVKEEFHLNLSDQQNGIYFLQIISEGKKEIKKIVVNK